MWSQSGSCGHSCGRCVSRPFERRTTHSDVDQRLELQSWRKVAVGSEMEPIQRDEERKALICWLDIVLEDDEITSVHCLFWKEKKEVMKHNIPLCSPSREKVT